MRRGVFGFQRAGAGGIRGVGHWPLANHGRDAHATLGGVGFGAGEAAGGG